MKNRKSILLVILFVSILTLIAGCGITITKNQYYSYSDQSEKTEQYETESNNSSDTLINIKNERN